MCISYQRTSRFKSWLCCHLQLPASALPGRQQVLGLKVRKLSCLSFSLRESPWRKKLWLSCPTPILLTQISCSFTTTSLALLSKPGLLLLCVVFCLLSNSPFAVRIWRPAEALESERHQFKRPCILWLCNLSNLTHPTPNSPFIGKLQGGNNNGCSVCSTHWVINK